MAEYCEHSVGSLGRDGYCPINTLSSINKKVIWIKKQEFEKQMTLCIIFEKGHLVLHQAIKINCQQQLKSILSLCFKRRCENLDSQQKKKKIYIFKWRHFSRKKTVWGKCKLQHIAKFCFNPRSQEISCFKKFQFPQGFPLFSTISIMTKKELSKLCS